MVKKEDYKNSAEVRIAIKKLTHKKYRTKKAGKDTAEVVADITALKGFLAEMAKA